MFRRLHASLALPVFTALTLAGSLSAQFSGVESLRLDPPVPISNERFGTVMSSSGDVLAVGVPSRTHAGGVGAGAVYLFERQAQSWVEVAYLTASDAAPGDAFGSALALDGDTLLVGAPQDDDAGTATGSVYVLVRDQGGADAWGEVEKLLPPSPVPLGYFGAALDLSGDTAAVGAPADSLDPGSAWIFERSGGSFAASTRLVPAAGFADDAFGFSVGVDGDAAVVGAPGGGLFDDGAVSFFGRDVGGAGAWGLDLEIPGASLGQLGFQVALDGDLAVAGEPGYSTKQSIAVGACYVYERDASGWGASQRLVAGPGALSQDRFGRGVALRGTTLLVGAPRFNASGAAFLFSPGLRTGVWERNRLDPAAGVSGDDFGQAVLLEATGAWVGSPGFSQGLSAFGVRGLALDTTSGTLYGTDFGSLLTIDPATGLASFVASQFGGEALAFDPVSGRLIGSGSNSLRWYDPSTGAITQLGGHGLDSVRGLAMDPSSGTLYGLNRDSLGTVELVSFDLVTGLGTRIGPVGFAEVHGLAFDPAGGLLYGSGALADQLLLIDTETGAGTLLGIHGLPDVEGLAWDPLTGDLLGSDDSTDELIRIDPTTSAGSSVGPFSASETGTVYRFELSAPFVGYCTAGTSASGCTAALSTTGVASATAEADFQLVASDAEGEKDGLFFFGTSGRQANPWGNGSSFQCVVPPVRRAGLLTGLGTPGSCDGAFAQDLNALWCPGCPGAAGAPGAGATVQAQLWYRDPLNTSNQTTSLSDAVEFLVYP